jgi:hypothetical protein
VTGWANGRVLGEEAMRRLRDAAVCDIEPGLTDEEFSRIEGEFGFEFADDHWAFLAAGLPVNRGLPPKQPGVISTHPSPWPDWRNAHADALRAFLAWPVEGTLFDVAHNRFWHDSWGSRPSETKAAAEVAEQRLAVVPQMIYGHRYLPEGRGVFGHPVLSMYQTDVIYYGLDLADYIDAEFGRRDAPRPEAPAATVEFWRDLVW